jgi:hypothetical protein
VQEPGKRASTLLLSALVFCTQASASRAQAAAGEGGSAAAAAAGSGAGAEGGGQDAEEEARELRQREARKRLKLQLQGSARGGASQVGYAWESFWEQISPFILEIFGSKEGSSSCFKSEIGMQKESNAWPETAEWVITA